MYPIGWFKEVNLIVHTKKHALFLALDTCYLQIKERASGRGGETSLPYTHTVVVVVVIVFNIPSSPVGRSFGLLLLFRGHGLLLLEVGVEDDAHVAVTEQQNHEREEEVGERVPDNVSLEVRNISF